MYYFKEEKNIMQISKLGLICILVLLLLSIVFSSVLASDLSGEEILAELKDETAFTASGIAEINLITENNNGQQKSNKLKIYRQEKDGSEKQLIEYLEPADVKGTKFLSIKEKDMETADMWLYLPALGRERRIAGHRIKDKFMDTDFTFEEIGGTKDYNQEYKAERLDDEKIDTYNSYVLKLLPKDNDSEYSQIKMWVWQQEMMPLKIEFFDEFNHLSKVMLLKEFQKKDDGIYQPKRVVMSNEIEGTRTIIEILESSSETVDELYFSIKYLRRD
jgi:outer membrane lipoprotein-sorting protein